MRWVLTSLATSMIGIVVLVACQGNVFHLKAGDCYNSVPFSGEYITEVGDVELVKCDEPHEREVYAIFDLPDSSWKGDDYVWEQVYTGCKAGFEEFFGIEPYRVALGIDTIYPLEESWNMGDRLVICSVYKESYMKVTGSLKGKGNMYLYPHESFKVGDCYNWSSTGTVETVGCAQPHTNEVYAIFDLPDSGWKGDDYVWEQVDIVCGPRFEEFVGIEYNLSTLDYAAIYPSEQKWDLGDRLAICSVVEVSGMKVTGSAKGSRR